MSAPAASVVDSDNNNTSTDDKSRLEQPSDAVPMQSIAQPSQGGSGPSKDEPESSKSAATENVAAASADASTAAAPAQPEKVDQKPAAITTTTAAAAGKDVDPSPLSPMAIGPAQDEITTVASGGPDSGPVCNITLLLTTGSRHPYKIDARYLNRRNVPIPEENENSQPDPFSISVYTLKELILREWRSDWESKPASPSSIRLIHFGKLLDDKEPLKTYHFSLENPNVVHMSIRPQDLDEEEPKAGGKNPSAGNGDGQRQRSGGCCVVL
ncbi:unnamed protein product [Clonostachys chloroleuca]|uniref:UBL3-like ubiquitin domain-containing protein n=1 Tax=Clonostachys chloroleuca TaxID=1926264 RepID=A0AA35Q4F9_9HYPO|nr:unnamed protein product [Clonostachys chloroleuca]